MGVCPLCTYEARTAKEHDQLMKHVADLRRRVAELEEDIASLKRRLADIEVKP